MKGLTRQQLTSQEDVKTLLFDKYRIRLMDRSDVPYVSVISAITTKEVIIVDLDKPDEESMEVFEEEAAALAAARKSNESTSCSEFGGSPLKFSFLTLSKLQANDKIRFSADSILALRQRFASNPMPAAEAGSITWRLTLNDWPFDSSLADVPVFIVSDARDVLNTAMLGVCRTPKWHSTYRIRAFGSKGDANVQKQIEKAGSLFQSFQGSYTAHCTYDIIPETPSSERDADARISGFLRLIAKWPSSSDEILSQPPPQAPVTVVVYPGWLDMRMPHADWSSELRLILALGRALRTGVMDWNEADLSIPVNDVFEDVKALLKEENTLRMPEETSYDFLDFTERLWNIMTGCRNNSMLCDVFGLVFQALRRGYKNTMVHVDNKSQMARFLRDACNDELMLPRLDGLTPIEIMLGMGLERFRRRCVCEVLSNELVANVKELDGFFNTRRDAPFEDRADAMFLLYNSLVILTACKQYLKLGTHQVHVLARRVLSQFDDLKLSPTTDGITMDYLKSFELKLNFGHGSNVTLANVYPNVFKIKTPKEWYLDGIYSRNKTRAAESITYFSKEPMLDYMWCSALANDKDVKDESVDHVSLGNQSIGEGEVQGDGGAENLNTDGKKTASEDQLARTFYCALIVASFHDVRSLQL